jgi:hypothetical protein
MIDPDLRNAIDQLHRAGRPLREISRQLNVSRNTVRAVVRQQGVRPPTVRKDKIHLDPELLQRLYEQCDGWLQRVHEKLVEEEHLQLSYQTLTRRARELGLGQPPNTRCQHVPDEPGAEMQHDTTVYRLRLGEQPTRLIASLLYLRYSKRRYLKFYRVFNRFVMKCFLHEALLFWGYAALRCIIDNTNLARLRGSGKRAVIVPETCLPAGRWPPSRSVTASNSCAMRSVIPIARPGKNAAFGPWRRTSCPAAASPAWRISIARRWSGRRSACTIAR